MSDDEAVEARTACAFGVPLSEHYPRTLPLFSCQPCRDEVARLCRLFNEAVGRGEYDREGYTPAERRLKERRANGNHGR